MHLASVINIVVVVRCILFEYFFSLVFQKMVILFENTGFFAKIIAKDFYVGGDIFGTIVELQPCNTLRNSTGG